MTGVPTTQQQKAQGAKCGCKGSDEMCPCQNVVEGTWFVERRLEWIKESVEIFGFINRAHVQKKFGVSTPQASYDLKAALQRWPSLMAYNTSAKRYERVG